MPKKLAIIHTSTALVETLTAQAKESLPGVSIINIVDDSLLPYARENGVDVRLRRRMLHYYSAAMDAGADAILNACSSVGEAVDAARPFVPVPILKIDEAMAEEAVRRGRRIAVLATVESTLTPTCRLMESKAREQDRGVELTPRLCDGALDLLLAGKVEEHDRAVTAAALDCAPNHDVIVLAQASMARLGPTLQARVAVPVLSSPGLALHRLAEILGVQ
jgi:Asp/Glu/hydantoin racemase